MTVEIVMGNRSNIKATEELIAAIKELNIEGSLYLGYPIFSNAERNQIIDALLISKDKGFVVFNFMEEIDSIRDTQDQLYFLIEGNLKKHDILRKGRSLAIEPQIITLIPEGSNVPQIGNDYKIAMPSTLKNILESCSCIDDETLKKLSSAIQKVVSIKPIKQRLNVKTEASKGAILKSIEKEIATLDKWQKKAAIEISDGPQRIRGLAGSGKTIVLALKAAYLHSLHPDWDIVVTYNTRSLKQQFKDLIERFTIEHSGEKPNWDKIRILHAWGSTNESGIYSTMSGLLNLPIINFALAKDRYSMEGAFEGVCNELYNSIQSGSIKVPQIFDVILIDEAQDLPSVFFKLIYKFTKADKRIIWAYDELQNISNVLMPPVEDLFGKDEHGSPNITIKNIAGEAQQDIILPVCYRNTPWALTLAHSLGFGIYRTPLVQLFDELELWTEIGYKVNKGSLKFSSNVELERDKNSYPEYFNRLITKEDAININRFSTKREQYEYMAKEIYKNVTEEELDLDDILIILPNAYTSAKDYQIISEILSEYNLASHLAGISTERDIFKKTNSITVSSIYRAKGNEAPMVYFVNADYCTSGHEMIRLRNILFTGITRSRAWLNIYGVGEKMDELQQEIDKTIIENDYKLSFSIPSKEELKKIRLIHRDRTKQEKDEIVKAKKELKNVNKLIDQGIINPEMLPELKTLLEKINNLESDNEL